MLSELAVSDGQATREKAERLRDDRADVRPVGWGVLAARDQTVKPKSRPWEHVTLG